MTAVFELLGDLNKTHESMLQQMFNSKYLLMTSSRSFLGTLMSGYDNRPGDSASADIHDVE
jgi:hypothetical protein